MAITYLTIRALASGEFASVSQANIEDAMAEAALLLDQDSWGATYYDRAHTLATAHILSQALEGSAGAAGPLTSVTAGAVSESYGRSALLDSTFWGSTSYGARLVRLTRKVFGGPRVL